MKIIVNSNIEQKQKLTEEKERLYYENVLNQEKSSQVFGIKILSKYQN